MRKLITLVTLVVSLALAGWTGAAEPGLMKVNINTDDAVTIAEVLDGVGMKKAEAIVAYRDANGAFQDASELVKVRGIGESTVSNNMERIEVEAAP
ncbi:MAG: helix-hairpin-helix domain-containing protein [Gammaproteobacteria bacterium]|nr:helix-hairpin-helix domain-containing protein [Gammaproteobacteria bacterium]MDE0273084.1 helix-hairpin-helix domain-containing protein [Gammaproteobacteria bacterium]